jgi:two-component system sensor histidine kinase UhpB
MVNFEYGVAAIVLVPAALLAGLFIQYRHRAEARIREREAQLAASYARIRDIGGRLLTAQETERARIARELHDDIGQRLALLALELRESRCDPKALADVKNIARSVSEISHRLHPVTPQLLGLVTSVHDLLAGQSRGPAVWFSHENVPPQLPSAVTLSLFRVVQEATQNAIQHSRARLLSVHLTGEASAVTLKIGDDGIGFDVDAAWGKGLGLISMCERIEAIGGTLSIESRPGVGTTYSIRVPLGVRRETVTPAEEASAEPGPWWPQSRPTSTLAGGVLPS